MAIKRSISALALDFCHIPIALAILLGVVFILRLPTLFEPYSYGDEMIYLTLGDGIKEGLVLYRDIHDNKPPLLYFTAAIAGNLFWFRAILAIWSLVTVTLFWKLMIKIFPGKQRIPMAATVVFAVLTTLPLLEGNIANAENYMIGFSILGFYLAIGSKNTTRLFLAGVAFSMAALFKIPAAFDLAALFGFWIITYSYKESLQLKKGIPVDLIKKIVVVTLGFLIPIATTFVWYASRGALQDYFIAAFGQNIGYLSSWRPDDQQRGFLEKNGPLLLRAGVVAAGCGILWIARKRLTKGYLLATVWLLVSLFAVTLSERPYPHYLLQSAAAASMLVGILFASSRMEQGYTVIPLAIVLLVPVYYRFYYYNTFAYYQRFIEFATGRINQQAYFDRFDGNVARNYKVARYLKETSKSDDAVFVWGDSPPIYALSHRLPPIKYVATYHINDFSSQDQVALQLLDKPPSFIVVLPEAPKTHELEEVLKGYLLINQIDGATIWRKTRLDVSKYFK